MKIKAISLRQPYANLVASGRKTLETRTWTHPHRGDLLICVSLYGKEEPRGVALCIVTLGEMRPMEAKDTEAACVEPYDRAHVWELSNLRPVRPHPIKGQLGIYEVEVPDDILL